MAGRHRAGGARGLRLGEVRGLRWDDVHLEQNTISVSRSLLPDGTPKEPKSAAGKRTVPLFPELRRLLVAWKVRSGHTQPGDLVVATADGKPVSERNLRRVLEDAKTAAGLDGGDGRLSWHSLRHSAGSVWLTEYGLAVTTVSAMMGHSTPAIFADVLARAADYR